MSYCILFNSALDILEEINLSTGRKNNFSEAALEKLLDNNLSQKYSQMGYLSSSNIITDGFYDYGQVSYFKLLYLERVKLSSQFSKSKRSVAKARVWLPKIPWCVFLSCSFPAFILISFDYLSSWLKSHHLHTIFQLQSSSQSCVSSVAPSSFPEPFSDLSSSGLFHCSVLNTNLTLNDPVDF